MPPEQHTQDATAAAKTGRRGELAAFIILAVLIWPILAIGFVGGYGFLVWMWQIIFGPPGPPGVGVS